MTTDNMDVKEWIRFARMDYDAARKMAEVFYPQPVEIICYHCQQAVEKILKAYAIANGEPLVKTHNLELLIGQCKPHSPDFDNYGGICAVLTPYAAASRYPPLVDLTETEMKIALKNAQILMDFTLSKLNELGCEKPQET